MQRSLRRRPKTWVMGLLAPLALVAVTPTSASAAETVPTEQELLSACGSADYCQFKPTSLSEGVGPEHQMGAKAYNCEGTVHRSLTVTDTTSQTTNASISSTLSADLFETAKISATATFGKSFQKSHTTTENISRDMAPFSKMWVTRGTALNVINGDWELHFPSRFHGHYKWYDKGYQITVEDPDGGGYVAYHYARMSSAEMAQICPESTPPSNLENFTDTRFKGTPPDRVLTGGPYVRDRGVFQGDGSADQ